MGNAIDRKTASSERAIRVAAFVVLCAAGLGWAAGPARAQAWQGREEKRDGVPWVLNPAEPWSPPIVVAAKELWREAQADAEERQRLYEHLAQPRKPATADASAPKGESKTKPAPAEA